MAYFLAASALLLSSVVTATVGRSANELVVIRQDNTSTGFIERVDVSTGLVTKQAKDKFVFDWPLVEMTADSNTEEVYVITYPEGYPGPVLYHLDHNLNLIYSWVNTPYSFFDLQYSPKQSAMYGILVTTSYGRALSNFTLDQQGDVITPKELYTLPYMWYVNASSFDAENSRYFALINNFPGFENSTLDQQLIVADFSKNAAEVAPQVGLYPIASQGMLVQFVTYSHSLRTLFCAGTSRQGAEVAVIDQESGRVTRRIFSKAATAVGPLMYVPAADKLGHDQLTVYVQTAVQPVPVWELWSLALQRGAEGGLSFEVKPTLINTYTGGDYQFFAGATVTK